MPVLDVSMHSGTINHSGLVTNLDMDKDKIISDYMASLGKKSWEKNKTTRDMSAIGKLGGAAGKGKSKKHAD